VDGDGHEFVRHLPAGQSHGDGVGFHLPVLLSQRRIERDGDTGRFVANGDAVCGGPVAALHTYTASSYRAVSVACFSYEQPVLVPQSRQV
jgi:hypothetical protein